MLVKKKINPTVKNLKVLYCMGNFKLLLKCKIANNKMAKVPLRIFIYSWILVCAFGNIRTYDKTALLASIVAMCGRVEPDVVE